MSGFFTSLDPVGFYNQGDPTLSRIAPQTSLGGSIFRPANDNFYGYAAEPEYKPPVQPQEEQVEKPMSRAEKISWLRKEADRLNKEHYDKRGIGGWFYENLTGDKPDWMVLDEDGVEPRIVDKNGSEAPSGWADLKNKFGISYDTQKTLLTVGAIAGLAGLARGGGSARGGLFGGGVAPYGGGGGAGGGGFNPRPINFPRGNPLPRNFVPFRDPGVFGRWGGVRVGGNLRGAPYLGGGGVAPNVNVNLPRGAQPGGLLSRARDFVNNVGRNTRESFFRPSGGNPPGGGGNPRPPGGGGGGLRPGGSNTMLEPSKIDPAGFNKSGGTMTRPVNNTRIDGYIQSGGMHSSKVPSDSKTQTRNNRRGVLQSFSGPLGNANNLLARFPIYRDNLGNTLPWDSKAFVKAIYETPPVEIVTRERPQNRDFTYADIPLQDYFDISQRGNINLTGDFRVGMGARNSQGVLIHTIKKQRGPGVVKRGFNTLLQQPKNVQKAIQNLTARWRNYLAKRKQPKNGEFNNLASTQPEVPPNFIRRAMTKLLKKNPKGLTIKTKGLNSLNSRFNSAASLPSLGSAPGLQLELESNSPFQTPPQTPGNRSTLFDFTHNLANPRTPTSGLNNPLWFSGPRNTTSGLGNPLFFSKADPFIIEPARNSNVSPRSPRGNMTPRSPRGNMTPRSPRGNMTPRSPRGNISFPPDLTPESFDAPRSSNPIVLEPTNRLPAIPSRSEVLGVQRDLNGGFTDDEIHAMQLEEQELLNKTHRSILRERELSRMDPYLRRQTMEIERAENFQFPQPPSVDSLLTQPEEVVLRQLHMLSYDQQMELIRRQRDARDREEEAAKKEKMESAPPTNLNPNAGKIKLRHKKTNKVKWVTPEEAKKILSDQEIGRMRNRKLVPSDFKLGSPVVTPTKDIPPMNSPTPESSGALVSVDQIDNTKKTYRRKPPAQEVISRAVAIRSAPRRRPIQPIRRPDAIPTSQLFSFLSATRSIRPLAAYSAGQFPISLTQRNNIITRLVNRPIQLIREIGQNVENHINNMRNTVRQFNPLNIERDIDGSTLQRILSRNRRELGIRDGPPRNDFFNMVINPRSTFIDREIAPRGSLQRMKRNLARVVLNTGEDAVNFVRRQARSMVDFYRREMRNQIAQYRARGAGITSDVIADLQRGASRFFDNLALRQNYMARRFEGITNDQIDSIGEFINNQRGRFMSAIPGGRIRIPERFTRIPMGIMEGSARLINRFRNPSRRIQRGRLDPRVSRQIDDLYVSERRVLNNVALRFSDSYINETRARRESPWTIADYVNSYNEHIEKYKEIFEKIVKRFYHESMIISRGREDIIMGYIETLRDSYMAFLRHFDRIYNPQPDRTKKRLFWGRGHI